ncbi:MAG: ABC transporter ATP-binding protein [Chloroflexota bacterium]
MSNIIEIKGLTKRYDELVALNDLTLNVEEGALFGFVGPNGAGKTTTMRILTTLLQASDGTASVAGHSVADEPQAVRRNIGYMPDFFGVYEDMKVWEYLDFFAACYDIPSETRLGMIDDLLALVDLNHKKEAYVESLSRGMKQRLCLARTLTHDPKVLILDEPASGLDPRARIEMRELLRELQSMGKTIFFSSHILSEISDVCTSIAILEAGKLVAHGNIEQIRRQLQVNRAIQVRVLSEPEPLVALLNKTPTVVKVETAVSTTPSPSPTTLSFDFSGNDADLSDLLAQIVGSGIRIISFSEEEHNLEDVFMQVTEGVVN